MPLLVEALHVTDDELQLTADGLARLRYHLRQLGTEPGLLQAVAELSLAAQNLSTVANSGSACRTLGELVVETCPRLGHVLTEYLSREAGAPKEMLHRLGHSARNLEPVSAESNKGMNPLQLRIAAGASGLPT